MLWSSAEFGFCELPDAWSAGSSIMPQKKNPDAAELLRAKAPRVVSHLSGLHGVMHALPLTYNKDLQEDKEHLFDAVDTLELALAAACGMVSGVSFDRERLEPAASDELIAATDVADLLVRRGLPVPRGPRRRRRASYAWRSTAAGSLSELTPEELRAHSELLDTPGERARYYEVLARDSWLESKVSQGGTALAARARAARAGTGRAGALARGSMAVEVSAVSVRDGGADAVRHEAGAASRSRSWRCQFRRRSRRCQFPGGVALPAWALREAAVPRHRVGRSRRSSTPAQCSRSPAS